GLSALPAHPRLALPPSLPSVRGGTFLGDASDARWSFMSSNTSTPEDPLAVLRSRRYLALLGFAAVLGVPISAAAYWFLWAIHHGRHWLFEALPSALGFATASAWWPVPILALGGLLAGAAIASMPGRGGHSPADGFRAGAPPSAAELPGVLLAALASL